MKIVDISLKQFGLSVDCRSIHRRYQSNNHMYQGVETAGSRDAAKWDTKWSKSYFVSSSNV